LDSTPENQSRRLAVPVIATTGSKLKSTQSTSNLNVNAQKVFGSKKDSVESKTSRNFKTAQNSFVQRTDPNVMADARRYLEELRMRDKPKIPLKQSPQTLLKTTNNSVLSTGKQTQKR